MNHEKKEVALVLSGGGARGMAHIGVIEVLLEKDYTITSIAGTSIGSLIGGVYLTGNLQEFKKWITSIGKYDVFRLIDFAISKSGFIKGEKVFQELRRFIPDVNIEDLPVPYAAVAVDVQKHEEVVFTKGRLADAIRASVSIPTVLKPHHLDGRLLVDGGVLNPLPLDRISRHEGDLLVAVDLNADVPLSKSQTSKKVQTQSGAYEKAKELINAKWSQFFKNDKTKNIGYFDLITLSIYAMQMKLTEISINRYHPDAVIKISRHACDIFEFHRAEELLNYGRKQCEVALSEISFTPGKSQFPDFIP